MNTIALKTLGLTAMFILLLISILLFITFSGLVDPSNILIFNFIKILFRYPLVIPACLIFLPSLLWKQSMFLAYSFIFGLILIAPFAQVIYQLYAGNNPGGLGETLGLAVIAALGIPYLAGMIIRAIFHSTIKNSSENPPSKFSFKPSDIAARNAITKNIS